MKHAKSAEKIPDDAQDRDEFIKTRMRTFEKDFIGALWRRNQRRFRRGAGSWS